MSHKFNLVRLGIGLASTSLILTTNFHSPQHLKQDSSLATLVELAQDTEEPAETEQKPQKKQEQKQAEENKATKFGKTIFKVIFDHLEQALILILGGAVFTLKKIVDNYKRKLESFFKPVPIKKNQTVNSVMVLGIGGVGKTTLIERLVNNEQHNINPQIKTRDYAIYDYKIKNSDPNQDKECIVYISDYPGARLDDLIRSFIKQQFIPHSPMRYGHVNSLIIVVDLCSAPSLPWEEVETDLESTSNEVLNRVQENLDFWNEQAITAIFGLISSSLKYICLFINKHDLLQLDSQIDEKAIKNMYTPLAELLIKKSSGVLLEVIVGSAEQGDLLENQIKLKINSRLNECLLEGSTSIDSRHDELNNLS